MNTPKAFGLVACNGPRFCFETMSATGADAHLDHPLWALPGVCFLVHLDVRGRDATDNAAFLISQVQTFQAALLAAQPAGFRFPGYGLRIAALGGAYAYDDFFGYLPFASHHPDDSLSQYINGFTYSPPAAATVTETGHPPTPTTFKIGASIYAARPNGGLVNNSVQFDASTPTEALRNQVFKITNWTSGVATVTPSMATLGSGITAHAGDTCIISSDAPSACYRFAAARASLAAWADEFFDELDATWPANLEPPGFAAVTTENMGGIDTAWSEAELGPFVPYLDADDLDPDFLTNNLSLTNWLGQYGGDQSGTPIDLSPSPLPGRFSPLAANQRSLSYGAFIVGLAWTWQLSFVNRMRRTWPYALFHQYQLHAGSRRAPVHVNPGEWFYHGDPWPPDVGHSHDEYYDNLSLYARLSAIAYVGNPEVGSHSTTSFVAKQPTPFTDAGSWGVTGRTQLRFDAATATVALRNAVATITGWNAGTSIVTCSTLPAVPANNDQFYGFVETPEYADWITNGVGWGVWKAYEDLYNHSGTLLERYRKTCISWALEVAEEMTTSWPDRNVAPFVARVPENGDPVLGGDRLYPEGPISQPGLQPRADWIAMLSGMMDAGIPNMFVFESSQAYSSVLDSWVEMLGGVRESYFRNRQTYQQLAAPYRNREWRER
ncbi:MAG: hypothetical protein SGI86_03520, partial [Deltaproteobacteria bacterium]|nr:hypothetical protein [Deltaproteobacteria bacterium]